MHFDDRREILLELLEIAGFPTCTEALQELEYQSKL
jgi:hypothetical protein